MSQNNKPLLERLDHQQLLELSPDAMLVIDDAGTIIFCNTKVFSLLGYPSTALLGQPIETLLPERLRRHHVSHRHSYALHPKLRNMGSGMELSALTSTGDELPVEISLNPVQTSAGLVVACAIRDISARRDVEAALRNARELADQASLLKSRFLAAASHDIRQPLQSMRLYLAALAEVPGSPAQADLLRKIQRTSASLSEILDTLLDLASLDSGRISADMARFSVANLLRDLLEDNRIQAVARSLDIRLVGCTLTIYSDRRLLARILGNFISNAIKYTPSGRILIGCRRRGDYLDIQVWDTGPGIATEQLESIFEEYVQLENRPQNAGGLGLGLSIVKRLSTLLGHEIVMRSTPGRGSMFGIRVPIMTAGVLTSGATQLELTQVRSTRVLFIEDDPDVAEATGLILRMQGYQVNTATSGAEAFSRVTIDDYQPDIILSDFRLRNDENGAQVVQRLRAALNHDVPVVFVTGDTSAARIRETNLVRCAVLHKPIDPVRLNKALQEGLKV